MPSSFLLFCQSGTSTVLKLEIQWSSSPSSKHSYFRCSRSSALFKKKLKASKPAWHPFSRVTLSKGLRENIGCWSILLCTRAETDSIRNTELPTSYRNSHIPYGSSSYLVCLILDGMIHHPESLFLLSFFSFFYEATLMYIVHVLKPSLILPVARVYKHTSD